MDNNFYDLFKGKKIIIGMCHLAGEGKEKIDRLESEIEIYNKYGVHGAIVEDYHGGIEDVHKALEVLALTEKKFEVGINVLRNPFLGFELADNYGGSFVQLDTVLDEPEAVFNNFYHERLREESPGVCVLGGVRFKYRDVIERSLDKDIKDGLERCDAIVTTGDETGMETPIDKLKSFRDVMGYENPLVVGAGVNLDNLVNQMEICDGAIVGSYFKNGHTYNKVDPQRVKEFMDKFNANFK